MKYFRILITVLLVIPLPGFAQKITKELVTSQNKTRTYYLFVPKDVTGPDPLLITLHGSGRNGLSLVEKWKDLASKVGLIFAGPDATNFQTWMTPEDGAIHIFGSNELR